MPEDTKVIKLEIGTDATAVLGTITAVCNMVTEITRGQSSEFRKATWDTWLPLLNGLRKFGERLFQ